jgi:hypothetical protein
MNLLDSEYDNDSRWSTIWIWYTEAILIKLDPMLIYIGISDGSNSGNSLVTVLLININGFSTRKIKGVMDKVL